LKILHLCLASFYIDNYSYQENMLPKFHKDMGLDVEIIASLVSFDKDGNPNLLNESGSYINEYGIPVTRLNYSKKKYSKTLRTYTNTYETICKTQPDIIFAHGCQFLDIKHVVKYVKLHPNTRIYVDNHADFSNSARNFLSKNILHKIIWKYCAHQIEPYTKKFYGVIPTRVDFLRDVYKLPKEKIELLVMGADDEKVTEAKDPDIKHEVRNKYNIKNEDLLIITGGKIDKEKRQILDLMEAVQKIDYDNLKLIVFGSVIKELKDEINKLADGVKVQYVGWIKSSESYKYFAASDLVVFPGRHSVLWEQAAGLGIPLIVRHWEGTNHVDLGGNCKFLYGNSVDEIYKLLMSLINNKDELDHMREIAESEGMKFFSYKDISCRAIEFKEQQ